MRSGKAPCGLDWLGPVGPGMARFGSAGSGAWFGRAAHRVVGQCIAPRRQVRQRRVRSTAWLGHAMSGVAWSARVGHGLVGPGAALQGKARSRVGLGRVRSADVWPGGAWNSWAILAMARSQAWRCVAGHREARHPKATRGRAGATSRPFTLDASGLRAQTASVQVVKAAAGEPEAEANLDSSLSVRPSDVPAPAPRSS